MLSLTADEICRCDNSAQLFNLISSLPGHLDDPDLLIETALNIAPSFTDVTLESLRKKFLGYLMAEQGLLNADVGGMEYG